MHNTQTPWHQSVKVACGFYFPLFFQTLTRSRSINLDVLYLMQGNLKSRVSLNRPGECGRMMACRISDQPPPGLMMILLLLPVIHPSPIAVSFPTDSSQPSLLWSSQIFFGQLANLADGLKSSKFFFLLSSYWNQTAHLVGIWRSCALLPCVDLWELLPNKVEFKPCRSLTNIERDRSHPE